MSGSFNPINLVSSVALAALTGGGSLYAQLAAQVVSQFGQELIQNMGQRGGMPQMDIELAQADFTSRYGDVQGTANNLSDAVAAFGQQTGASPADIGDTQRMVQDLLHRTAADAMESEEVKDARAGGGKSGGGWLRAIARAMGEAADKTADKLEKDARGLDNAKPSESAEYSADAQAFSMLMNSINTAIKSIGESLGTMARKQ